MFPKKLLIFEFLESSFQILLLWLPPLPAISTPVHPSKFAGTTRPRPGNYETNHTGLSSENGRYLAVSRGLAALKNDRTGFRTCTLWGLFYASEGFFLMLILNCFEELG